ncbi:type II toxin-antitoxin system VapC family toxin [Candidatus Bathyarchaeota archaeon]|nr:type II toxin-antitoxin system VapC family toxin [Candidatus Bathyarchaeota archaeon]
MIFIDTTVWVGDADLNDELHESAHQLIESVRTGRSPLGLITDFIINETVTILGRRRGFGAHRAVEVGRAMLTSPRVFTVYVDEGILNEALTTYPAYDGRLSLTDVVSTIVMKRYGVREIFSHDADFDSVGGIRRLASTHSGDLTDRKN